MQNTVRTTIRIRKDIIDQSRLAALKKNVSLQDVINDTLAVGLKHVTDFNAVGESMKQIDDFRQSISLSKDVKLADILKISKKDLR